jgi:hypothetical protein
MNRREIFIGVCVGYDEAAFAGAAAEAADAPEAGSDSDAEAGAEAGFALAAWILAPSLKRSVPSVTT